MTVNLAPTADATQRTRNRIKEHGPVHQMGAARIRRWSMVAVQSKGRLARMAQRRRV